MGVKCETLGADGFRTIFSDIFGTSLSIFIEKAIPAMYDHNCKKNHSSTSNGCTDSQPFSLFAIVIAAGPIY